MVRTFLSHSVKRLFRSPAARKSIAAHFALGVFSLIGLGIAIGAGFLLKTILIEKISDADPVKALARLMLYCFSAELIVRYFLQRLPALDILPYLHLPIHRNRIVHFLLLRSLFNFFTLLPFGLFLPFTIGAVAEANGLVNSFAWFLTIWVVSLTLHFMVIVLKQRMAHSPWMLVIFFVVYLSGLTADQRGWFQLSNLSERLFGDPINSIGFLPLITSLMILSYFIAFRMCRRRMYPDELTIQTARTPGFFDLGHLHKLGLIGSWMNLELKLIFRNKRSREVFWLHIMFSVAVLIVWHQKMDSGFGFYFMLGLFSSGCFTGNYGQYLYGWQAHHFDFTLTQPTSIRYFIESKYWLLTTITVLWFLISLPFSYFGWHFLLITFVCAVFNIGVNTFIVMNMAMWRAQKIDLTHRGSLNYEGSGAAQWLMGIPLFAIPALLFFPLSLLGYTLTGLVVVGGVGVAGIVFRNVLIDLTTRRLLNMRYTLAVNFKKD